MLRMISLASAGALLAVGLAGCTTTPPVRPSTSSGSGAQGAAAGSLVATGSPTDSHQPLEVAAYPPGSACQAVTALTRIDLVPGPCATAWAPFAPDFVPGQEIVAAVKPPANVALASGISPQSGLAVAQAFVRTEAFQSWAVSQRLLKLDLSLNPVGFSDPIDQAISKGGQVALPDCYFPTAIRVTTVPDAALDPIRAAGFPNPSPTGVVLTFPACGAVNAVFTGQGSSNTAVQVEPAHPARSVLETGAVVQSAALGNYFQPDGDAECGSSALLPVCSPTS